MNKPIDYTPVINHYMAQQAEYIAYDLVLTSIVAVLIFFVLLTLVNILRNKRRL